MRIRPLCPQLEKEEQIHSVHLGNDGSAFVEVLVGSSAGGSAAGEQDYEVSRAAATPFGRATLAAFFLRRAGSGHCPGHGKLCCRDHRWTRREALAGCEMRLHLGRRLSQEPVPRVTAPVAYLPRQMHCLVL